MGGVYPDNKKNISCLHIDANMNVLEKEPMPKGPRSNLGVALLLDKFIFCIGGEDLNSRLPQSTTEIYDTT